MLDDLLQVQVSPLAGLLDHVSARLAVDVGRLGDQHLHLQQVGGGRLQEDFHHRVACAKWNMVEKNEMFYVMMEMNKMFCYIMMEKNEMISFVT